ncbi:MAG: hypothetical protein JXC36_06425 [Candidatus Atribacteria bacterium]|nr:hypothetical protein [Candidatus Atribacteria bacterium]
MTKEKSLNNIKAEVSFQIQKMAFHGIKIALFEWKDNNLRIHTTNNEGVVKIANLIQQLFPGWLSKISISICGETKVMKL